MAKNPIDSAVDEKDAMLPNLHKRHDAMDKSVKTLTDQVKALSDAMPNEQHMAGIMAALKSYVDFAISTAREQDQADDAKQMQAIISQVQDTVMGGMAELVTTLANSKAEEQAERKAMMQLLIALAKPKKRTGEVQLPSGKVKMIIQELDS